VIAFPRFQMQASVSLTYGVIDSLTPLGPDAGARVALYVNGALMGDADSWNAPGWHELVADTGAQRNTTGDVVLLIDSDANGVPAIGLRLTSSVARAPAFSSRQANRFGRSHRPDERLYLERLRRSARRVSPIGRENESSRATRSVLIRRPRCTKAGALKARELCAGTGHSARCPGTSLA